jgi:hypothetical protein
MPNDTYTVEIIRDSLEGFTNRVQNEESGGSEFQGNLITSLDGQLVNLASFRELPIGQLLPLPSFVKLGELPDGTTAAWTGVLLIGSLNVAAEMFRIEGQS